MYARDVLDPWSLIRETSGLVPCPACCLPSTPTLYFNATCALLAVSVSKTYKMRSLIRVFVFFFVFCFCFSHKYLL